MEEKWVHSFRFQCVMYALLSVLCATIVAGIFYGSIYFINLQMTRKPDVKVTQEEQEYTAITNQKPQLQGSNSYQPTTDQQSEHKDYLKVTISLTIGIWLIAFALIFSIFTKRVDCYLQEIVEGIDELSKGNFNLAIPLRKDDQLTQIALKLNRVAYDIKEIMEKERTTENKKNELITNVAHDLRTPLTSILGYLDIVTKQKLSKEEQTKYIGIAYHKSKRLEKMVEDLFTYTKLEFGQIQLQQTKMDLVKMMEQMLEEFYPSFQEHALDCAFETQEDSVFIMADGDMLARAFANLLSNAIRYGADGKNIKVNITTNQQEVVVHVINFGSIIPAKDLEHIFEKFYRVDRSRNEEQGGTGLGLAITKNIIRMHGGNIKVHSDLNGTEFEVMLQRT